LLSLHWFSLKIQDEIVDTAGVSGNGSSQNSCETKSQTSSRLSKKEFVPPLLKAGHIAPKINQGVNEIKPRYNPNHPSALVMPRPPTDIQVCVSINGIVH
jgi:hypothetical protein